MYFEVYRYFKAKAKDRRYFTYLDHSLGGDMICSLYLSLLTLAT